MNVRCPNCRAPLTVPAGWAGDPLKCAKCGATVRGKPKAAPAGDPFAFADDTPAVVRPRDVRKRGGGPPVVLGLLLVAAVGGGVAYKAGVLTTPTAPTADEPVAETKPAATKPGALPRRLLVVSVSKYLYCNRLAAGVGRNAPDLPSEIGKRLAFDWRVPQDPGNQQLVVLSDTSADPRPMLKPIISKTVADFCRTSRPQDRVMVYIGGHAIEAGGKAYLVPAEGDPGDPDSLIPLAELWEQLKACPATQKVVVFDVCRMNEDEDRVRPGGEPMSPELEKQLLAAPPGVQVVLTCSAKQQAREYRRTPADPTAADVTGSLFLSAVRHVTARTKPTTPTADDPLPVAELLAAVGRRMATVCEATGHPAPTPKVSGSVGQLAATDPAAPPAEAVSLPPAPVGLPPAEVAKLTAAITLPPIHERPTAGDDEAGLPYLTDRMAAYAPPPADSKLRTAAADGLEEIRKQWKLTSAADETGGLRSEFNGATDDAVKKSIAREQETPARLVLALSERAQSLDKLAAKLAEEKSPYWRATVQFARGQLKARLAFMEEYNLLLADIRADRLPPRDPKKGETGLQLVSVAKMKSKKDVQELAAAAHELFAEVAKDHPGTPWAVAAKRAKAEALGLEWRPFAPGGKPKAE